MTTKKYLRLGLFTAIFVGLVFVVRTGGALSGAEAAAEIRLKYQGNSEQKPTVYGDYLLWLEDRDGAFGVRLNDFRMDVDRKMSTETIDPEFFDGDLTSWYAVWVNKIGGQYTLDLHEIPTWRLRRIQSSNAVISSPVAVGKMLAWLERRPNSGLNQVMTYDLDFGTLRQITDDTMEHTRLDIADDYLVWVEKWTTCKKDELPNDCARVGQSDLVVYDFAGGMKKVIRQNVGTMGDLEAMGSNIVWAEVRNGQTDVFLYDRSTSKERQLTNSKIEESDLALYGDKVAWTVPTENKKTRIVLLDLDTSELKEITSGRSIQKHLSLSRERLVYQDNRRGQWDVHMYEFFNDGVGLDQDKDGLSDKAEIQANASVFAADTDNDGLTDHKEVQFLHTNPGMSDSDGDGFTDIDELQKYETDPSKFDTDGDGYGDKREVLSGYSPLVHAKYNSPYKVPRLTNPEEEMKRSKELHDQLVKKVGSLRGMGAEKWFTYVNAYIYGGYSVQQIVTDILGGKKVHPTIPAGEL